MNSRGVALRLSLFTWGWAGSLLLTVSTRADTVLRYSFSDSTVLPVVEDASPAENHAAAGPLADLSADVPAPRPLGAGNRSLDASDPFAGMGNESGLVTDNTLLLANPAIAAAGGFSMELWFRWFGGGTVNALLDYAGTEKIVLDQSQGPSPRVELRIASFGDLSIGDAVADRWHYLAVVFDTDGAPLNPNGSITGTVTVFFDEAAPSGINPNVTKNTVGDSLDRGIGVGMHPLGLDPDFFDGLIFEPRVTLGPLAPETLLISTLELPFRRGDADGDGTVNGLIDGVFLLAFQFISGSPAPPCVRAADADDNGRVSGLVDGLFVLNYQFVAGSNPPPQPGPNGCGFDPTDDALPCEIYDCP